MNGDAKETGFRDMLRQYTADWPGQRIVDRTFARLVQQEWVPPRMDPIRTISGWFYGLLSEERFGRGFDLLTLLDVRGMLLKAVEKIDWIIGFRYGAAYMGISSQEYRDHVRIWVRQGENPSKSGQHHELLPDVAPVIEPRVERRYPKLP